jgi:spore maturation protein CgeB
MKSNLSILILGAFSKGAIEHNFVRGLKQAGYSVHCLDIQLPVLASRNTLIKKIYFKFSPSAFYLGINREVLIVAKELKPTVILIFKGMELFPKTVAELKTYTKCLCNYNPDHPLEIYSQGAGNKNIIDSLHFYDIHFSYSKNITKKLQNHTKRNCYTIPFGYDETLLVQQKSQDFLNFFAFIGAYDRERAKKLTLLNNPNLNIYGNREWKTRNPFNDYLQHHFQQKSLYEDEYAQVSANCLGVLNFLRHQNLVEDSHNMRTFEVPAFGGILIADRTTEQMEFFEEDKEAIFFGSIAELEDKLIFLHNNPMAVAKIKEAALIRSIKSNYSYLHRVIELLKYITFFIKQT